MINLNSISSIIRQSTKTDSEPWNILTYSTHERYDQNLAKVNANFFALPGNEVRTWNEKYSKIPENYRFVKNRIPPHLSFDCIITGNPFIHIPLAVPISKQLHIPIINIFHTDSAPNWSKSVFEANRAFFNQCQHHVFITEYNRISWGFKDEPCTVIEHGIDSDQFCASETSKEDIILTVGNDFINRDRELGYSLWKYMTQGLPTKVIGSNPGLSEPAQTQQDLIGELQRAKVYLNTTLKSPFPMSLLEAMSCGLGIVTTNTNAIADCLTHGYDCLMFSPNEPDIGRQYLEVLLHDASLRETLGKNARKTAIEKFPISKFVEGWEGVLNNVCNKAFLE